MGDCEVCSVLIRCTFGHFQEGLDKVLVNYKLAVRILKELCDERVCNSVHNWLTVAKKGIASEKYESVDLGTKIANELIEASNGLLHVDDFLGMLDLISDDLKIRLVKQLQVTSDEVERKKKGIKKNRIFLDKLSNNFEDKNENISKNKIVRYKYQFPCGCGWNNK